MTSAFRACCSPGVDRVNARKSLQNGRSQGTSDDKPVRTGGRVCGGHCQAVTSNGPLAIRDGLKYFLPRGTHTKRPSTLLQTRWTFGARSCQYTGNATQLSGFNDGPFKVGNNGQIPCRFANLYDGRAGPNAAHKYHTVRTQ